METDVVIKVIQQSGPVTMAIGIIALVLIKYIVPLCVKALAVHKEDLAKVLEEGRIANQAVVKAFQESQDRQERQTERMIQVVIDKLGGDLAGMRKDLDKVVVTLDGLRNDLSGHVSLPKTGG